MTAKPRPNAEEIKRLLNLQELPFEGGFFRQTYVPTEQIAREHLPARYAESKPFSTAILFLLTPESFSAFHKLATDEVYHYYLGDPAELYELHADGSSRNVILGPDLVIGHQVQHVVPRGVWQGSQVHPGGKWTLLGTTMAPGYTQNDFELAQASVLIEAFPEQRDIIRQLTRTETA
ncbi:MAG: cupin domain-containing protein [Anaerolineales bacterium]